MMVGLKRRALTSLVALVSTVLVFSSCGLSAGKVSEQVQVKGMGDVRQVDDDGKRLPFVTVHPNRWSSANNGTTYEPCTAIVDSELRSLQIDVSSVSDAAGTDGQTIRGCTWQFEDHAWLVSQFVGNSDGLEEDRNRNRTSFDVWLPDVVVGGRVVGMHRATSGTDCDTYVQVEQAGVYTLVTHSGRPHPPVEEICAKALEFTEATIGKMPR